MSQAQRHIHPAQFLIKENSIHFSKKDDESFSYFLQFNKQQCVGERRQIEEPIVAKHNEVN